MDNKDIKIVFMGTPEFAVPVLNALHDNFNVICCITKADTPKGRGGKMRMCKVKERALALGIPVLSPEKIRTQEFYETIGRFEADFFVTCAYGKILPPEILALPRGGTVNVHASLLPKLRGANPIQRAVMNGDTVSGVTTMLTDEGMDTGDMLLREETAIDPEMSMKELHDLLSDIGAKLIVKTVEELAAGTLKGIPQDGEEATFAPKLESSEEQIDWTRDAKKIHDLIRALDDKPGAWTSLEGRKFKIFRSEICDDETDAAPGTITGATKKYFTVKCGKNSIKVIELQPENGKRMPASAYLNGHRIEGTFEYLT